MPGLSQREREAVVGVGIVGLCLLAVFLAHSLFGSGTQPLFDTWIHNALLVMGAAGWLDGAIVGFAVAALVAALALGPIVDASSDHRLGRGPGPGRRLVRSSGERRDGAGYPDSLAGEQIPGSRVVAAFERVAARSESTDPRRAGSS